MKVLSIMVGLLLIAGGSWSAERKVPSEYATIQAAIDASASGDVVLVAPGEYVENIRIALKSVRLTSEWGAEQTILSPKLGSKTVIEIYHAVTGFTIEGITVTHGGPVHTVTAVGSSGVIQNCIFAENVPVGTSNTEVISLSNSAVTVTGCVFYGNGGIGCVGLRTEAEGSKIINNTFDGNERGIFSIASGGIAINNIISNSLVRGITAVSSHNWTLVDYNDVWNNGIDYVLVTPGQHDIKTDPLFAYSQDHDYFLQYSSPCLDAGHPDPIYNDPDGSRSDIGALPVQQIAYPMARNPSVSPVNAKGFVTDSFPEIGWIYDDTGVTVQFQYHIQVGSDADWAVAELWDSGPVVSSIPAARYGGIPLPNLSAVYIRVRLANVLGWGDWSARKFQTKTQSVIRVPQFVGTIQEGINMSFDGDTILIGAGTYREKITVNGRNLVLKGESGAALTILSPSAPGNTTISIGGSGTNSVALQGLTVTGGTGANTVVIQYVNTVIEECIFHHNISVGTLNTEVISVNSSPTVVRRCLFYRNGGIGCVGLHGESQGSVIVNNTFDRNERGIYSTAPGGTAINNIITNSRERGIGAATSSSWTRVDYNDVWANSPDYYIWGTQGEHDIHADPIFMAPNDGNYQLQLGSPCIDAGDPDPFYNNPNGSRCDIGAHYRSVYPPTPPYAASPIGTTVYDLTPEIIWYRSTDFDEMDQIRYDLTIATDAAFLFTHTYTGLLDSQVSVTDTLTCSTPYWWKVRATDLAGLSTESEPVSFRTWTPGDLDNSRSINVADLTRFVDFLFREGAALEPALLGDYDGSCAVNVADLTYLVNFLFKGGTTPKVGCTPG